MASCAPLRVKVASEHWEIDQVHALNHRTFAGEIPQHATTASGRLIDRFHEENTYVIALQDDKVVGMLAIRGCRPFSLHSKLPDLDAYLPPERSVCELRLLAVEKGSRFGAILPALLECAWSHIQRQGFEVAIISAIVQQLRLYRHLGFEPFGPIVGTRPVEFQPMLLTRDQFARRAPALFRRSGPTSPDRPAVFLPGPVAMHADVRQAFARAALSHRSAGFRRDLHAAKAQLSALTGAARVAVLLGSGTMANDVIAGQLSRRGSAGLVLSNGEFGDRLAAQARRWRLDACVIAKPWGAPYDPREIASHLQAHPQIRWVWFTHVETSTGVLNDLDEIVSCCREAGAAPVVDAISSIGTLPVDLSRVDLASGVSGKGLGSFPGLAFVFHEAAVSPAPNELPAILDLGLYADSDPPFTHSSNLVAALRIAIERTQWPTRCADLADRATWFRARLAALGLQVVGTSAEPAPGIVTIQLPSGISSARMSEALERMGFLVSAHSRYLSDRHWIQIGLMGEVTTADLATVSEAVRALLNEITADVPGYVPDAPLRAQKPGTAAELRP